LVFSLGARDFTFDFNDPFQIKRSSSSSAQTGYAKNVPVFYETDPLAVSDMKRSTPRKKIGNAASESFFFGISLVIVTFQMHNFCYCLIFQINRSEVQHSLLVSLSLSHHTV